MPRLRRLAAFALCGAISFGSWLAAVGGARATGSISAQVVANPLSASVSLSASEVEQGQSFQATGLVGNEGSTQLLNVGLELRADGQMLIDAASRSVSELPGGSVHRDTWTVCGSLPGSYLLLLAAQAIGPAGHPLAVESSAVLVVVSPASVPCGGFPFVGFDRPVDNPPVVNLATAGSAIPVKFSLGGDRGLGIFAVGYPASGPIGCDSALPLDIIEETVSPGSSSLSYDAATTLYTYVWKSKKPWAGTCRDLLVRLVDGSLHRASFKFRK